MNKNGILLGVGGLIIGLVVGFFAANSINRNALPVASQIPTNAAPSAPSQQVPNVLVKEQTQSGGMMPDIAAAIDRANNNPNDFDAQIRAGDLYQQIKGFDKAAAFYERAHQANPNDYELLVKLGNTCFDARQFEAAAKWYEQALAKKPDDANVRTDLGITFVERAAPDYDRAIKEFQTSLQVNPKNEPTLYNLGAAYFRKGNIEEANKMLAQLEAVNPNSQLVARLRQVTK